MLRKIGIWILLLLAILGLLVCVVGIVGSWMGRSAVDQIAADLLKSLDGSLNNATQVIEEVDQRLVRAGEGVDALTAEVERVVAAGSSPAEETMRRLLGTDAGARLQGIGPMIEGLYNAAVGLNDSLVAVNRMPRVDVPTFSSELEAVGARLQGLQQRVDAVEEAVKGSDGTVVLHATGELSAWLGEAQASITQLETRLTEGKESLDALGAAIPGYTQLAAWVLTLFLLLMAAGQVSLIAHCWRWARA